MVRVVLLRILTIALTSIPIYFGIAATMLLIGKVKKPDLNDSDLVFDELYFNYSALPRLESFQARDGGTLFYRHYESESNTVLILLHGSGWHSQYFLPLAEYLSSQGYADVYTPDLRGHGAAPDRRGDVDYINQLEDDLADLISLIRRKNPKSRIVIGGHSSGGGLVVRFAGSRYGKQADAYMLLSPYLKYNAPTMRPSSGGWTVVNTPRIVGLSMLNNVGIHRFDYLPVISFNMPEEARDGTETLTYSHRLNTGYAPRNYKRDLAHITQPLLVVAGTADEAFVGEQFEPVISQYTEVQVELIPHASHFSVVVGPEVRPILRKWFESF